MSFHMHFSYFLPRFLLQLVRVQLQERMGVITARNVTEFGVDKVLSSMPDIRSERI